MEYSHRESSALHPAQNDVSYPARGGADVTETESARLIPAQNGYSDCRDSIGIANISDNNYTSMSLYIYTYNVDGMKYTP